MPIDEKPPAEGVVETEAYLARRGQADSLVAALRKLSIARVFTGVAPMLVVLLLSGGAMVGVHAQRGLDASPDWKLLGYVGGGALLLSSVIVFGLKILINRKVQNTYGPLREAVADCRSLLATMRTQARQHRDEEIKAATKTRNDDVDAMRQRLAPVQAKAQTVRENALNSAESELQKATEELDGRVATQRGELDRRLAAHLAESESCTANDQKRLKDRHATDSTETDAKYKDRRADLQRRYREGLADIQAPMGQDGAVATGRDWRAFERNWQPPVAFPPAVSIGSLLIDIEKISAGIPKDAVEGMSLPSHFNVPALLAFPSEASLLIETDPESRETVARHAADGDDASAHPTARRPGTVHDHRPGRPRPKLRRLHAPGRPRRPARHRPHLDDAGADRSTPDRPDRAHGNGHSEIPAQRIQHDRPVQRPGRRTGRTVPRSGGGRFSERLRRRKLASAAEHRPQRRRGAAFTR
ncbi:MAG: hypothetical protein QM754_19650 [Tepidisphaeraceae bacterium]